MGKSVKAVVALAVALLLAVGVARAEERILQNKADYIRLMDAPCTSTKGALGELPPQMRAVMFAARVYWEGQLYDACWVDLDALRTFILDETGDNGPLDASRFKPVYDA